MSKTRNIDITIFIPTFNAADYLKDIIVAISKQDIDREYELLIIDSGSTDDTLDIIEKYSSKVKNFRMHQIPNSEFGHGKTRQLAAEMARGKYMVYLSHDAIPSHNKWLYEMIKPMEISSDVVAVLGKQVPRIHCPPLIKYDIQRVFSSLGSDMGVAFFYNDYFINDKATFDFVRFYSDVNSATRKDFLLKKIPYRDVDYAEDQQFGEDIIKAGYIKAYSPRGSVVHSNDVRLKDFHRRIFDEYFALRKNSNHKEDVRYIYLAKNLAKGILVDTVRILLDKNMSRKRKVYWIVINPFFHIQKARGSRNAFTSKVDSDVSGKSLERRNIKK